MAEPQYVNPGTEQQKRAVLEAMARAGTAGKQAFDAAQAELSSVRQNALGRMLSTPGPDAPNASAPMDATHDRFASALANQRASFDSDLARRQASNESYLSQVDAAAPVIKGRIDERYQQARADLENEVGRRRSDLESALAMSKQRYEAEQAAAQQKAAQDAADRNEDRGFAREKMDFERAKMAAEALKAASGGDLSSAEIEEQLIGAGRRALEGNAPISFANGPSQRGDGSLLRPPDVQWEQKPLSTLAREIGVGANFNPNTVFGRIGPEDDAAEARNIEALAPKVPQDVKAAATRARVSVADYTAIRSSTTYREAQAKAQQLLTAGVTREEFLAAFRTDLLGRKTPQTRTFQILEAELAPLFPSINETSRLADYETAG